ncbi:MAG: hypothetical protein GC168_18325 [Candidatus Hydrogenedens sp.]|nr:hypothetical protein [Candidatus Hydrogenedens sp.]
MENIQLENESRSKLAVWLLLLVILGILAWWVPAGPRANYLSARAELDDAQSGLQMAQLDKMDAETRVEQQRPIAERLRTRPSNFSFITFLQRTLNEVKLQERSSLNQVRRSSQESDLVELVEVKLNNISLEELVNFLHTVYDANNLIALYQLSYLRPTADAQGLECMLTFVTLRPES